MLQSKEKSDTRRYHSPCQTSSSARVALQRCPILCGRKSNLSVAFDQNTVNVQSRRRNCLISPTRVSNHADSRCLTAPTYSKITIYLKSEFVFVTMSDSSGVIMSSKSRSNQLAISAIDILPQIGLIKENEKLLTEQTIKSDKDTYLSSRHFRNELLLFKKGKEPFTRDGEMILWMF